MKNISFSYDITIHFEISKEDFDLLCAAFNSHHEVKRYIEYGEWMYGLKGRLDYLYTQGEPLEMDLTDRQIDKCCKAIELASFGEREKYSKLYADMFNLHKQIVQEYKRIIGVCQ
jgi:hypothetical protein